VDHTGKYGFRDKPLYDEKSKYKPGKDEMNKGNRGDLIILKADSGKYKFWLYTNKGWPNYHSGSMDGFIEIKDNKAVYKVQQDFAETPCVVTFTFKNGAVEIEQDGSDGVCGLGAGVYLDGTYKKLGSQKITNEQVADLYLDFSRYRIVADKAFLYEDGSGGKKKKQYFIKGDVVFVSSINDNYVYVEFISASGKLVYGWIKRSDIKELN
ncbi:MAG TPA: hypothetical protein VHL77_09100, partial [Ferruginibacter sp.]|nr:hypothetical protein [Ferruginibacter sp.]